MKRTPTHRHNTPTLTVAAIFGSRDRNAGRTPTHRGEYRNG